MREHLEMRGDHRESARAPLGGFGSLLLSACFLCLLIGCGSKDTSGEKKEDGAFLPVRTIFVQIEPGSVLDGREKEIESVMANDFGALPSLSRAKIGRGIIVSLQFDNSTDKSGALLEVSADFQELEDPIATGVASTSLDISASAAMEMVRKTSAEGAEAMKKLLSLVDAKDARLAHALSSPEPDEQIAALNLLGHRRLRKYVVEVARLLKDPRARVADEAAQTLVEIGDPKAVPLLIASIERENLRSEVRAVEAMGKLGGQEAAAYLEMTAVGHEVPEVRSLSEVLLRRIRSSEKKSNKSL